jgi:hypothetical protein
MTEHQPREHSVVCAVCAVTNPRHPVTTWNVSGLCDAHETT